MRCYKKASIVRVEKIDEETYLVIDGDTRYTITKQEYDEKYQPI